MPRSPTEKRKSFINPPKIQNDYGDETKNLKKANEKIYEASGMTDKHVSRTLNKKIEQKGTPSDVGRKEMVTREIIEARSAFNTIKNYCKSLIRGSTNSTASNRDEHRKNIIPLNFFAKPVVDRPISLP